MHDELVKSLRELCDMTALCDDYNSCFECPCYEECSSYKNGRLSAVYRQAADAIEELSCREAPMKITEIHVDEYYCPACGAENNCDQGHVQDAYCPSCGQRLLPQHPKEE